MILSNGTTNGWTVYVLEPDGSTVQCFVLPQSTVTVPAGLVVSNTTGVHQDGSGTNWFLSVDSNGEHAVPGVQAFDWFSFWSGFAFIFCAGMLAMGARLVRRILGDGVNE